MAPSSTLLAALALLSGFTSAAPTTSTNTTCVSSDQPNPISSQYSDVPTGTLNGTVLVLPIPLAKARALIPSNISILQDAYYGLLPAFPKDSYPLLFSALHDHDISAYNVSSIIPDFSRAGFNFPFLDLLHDSSTPFTWVPSQLVTATNTVALAGLAAYGQTAYPSVFTPSCDAYTASRDGATRMFSGNDLINNTYASLAVYPLKQTAYSKAFWKNVTNQPIFGDQKLGVCDNMMRLWNTSLSEGQYAPRYVAGAVKAKMEPVGSVDKHTGRWEGVQVDTPFIENNLIPCGNLRGYHGTGEGDSSWYGRH